MCTRIRSVSITLPLLALFALCVLLGAPRPARAAGPAQDAPPAAAISAQVEVTAPVTSTGFLRTLLPIIHHHTMPRSPSPAGNATRQSLNVNLAWIFDNPAAVNPTYTIYLEANDPTPEDIFATGITRTVFDPPTFELDTRYYWQVEAVSADGQRYVGPVWSFTTDTAFDPAVNPGDVETLITIPEGEFQMGCDKKNPDLLRDCEERDRYLHPVWLDAYAIDKYEVTNKQYRACVDAGACNMPRETGSYRRAEYFYPAEFDYYPVLYVSWWDARAYCEWKGKRLPTEAEWEKAARGTMDTRSWPWGSERPDCTRANFVVDWEDPHYGCVGDTSQVGSYPAGASPYGVVDMSGNAFEWVWDNWEPLYYYVSPYMNPQGPNRPKTPESEPFFVIRGGSYRPRWYYIMTNRRHFGHHGDCVGCDAPYYRNDQVGFRCAKSLQ